MRELSSEDYKKLTTRPHIQCVDSDTRSIIYNVLKDHPEQEDLFLVTQHIASNFAEVERFKKFGIYLDRSVFILEEREYVLWIEPPLVEDLSIYVDEVLRIAEIFKETYLKDKTPKYYFLNGEFPSQPIYLEVHKELQGKFPDILSLFPIQYDLSEEELSSAFMEEMGEMLEGLDYTVVSMEEITKTFYRKLVAKEEFNSLLQWLEEQVEEVTRGKEKPLLVFPNSSVLSYDLADSLGTYIYFRKGIPYFDGDRGNQIGLMTYNLITLDPNTLLLSDRIQYLKNLPDLNLMIPRGTPTKYLSMGFKHTLDLINNVKFIYLDAPSTLQNKDLDLAEINIISVEDHYQLGVMSVIAEENYKELHKDINRLQKLLSPRDACLTHSNTLLFYHEGNLAMGYIAELRVSMRALVLPLLPELPHFETTLNYNDIKRLVPLGMFLNINEFKGQVKALLALYKETYPNSKPRLTPYISKLSLKGLILRCSKLDNQYRPSDIDSMVLWALWSPLSKMNREEFFPILSGYIDLKIFREESLYYTFFNTGYGGLSVTINLNKKFMKGEVNLEN